jgi:pectate lyase
MINGAFFVTSGESLEVKYEKAFSVEPQSANRIVLLTMNSGVLGNARYQCLIHYYFIFFP